MTTKKKITVAISIEVKAVDEKTALTLLDKVLKARHWDYTPIGPVKVSELPQKEKKVVKEKSKKKK